jgi:large subunit ribosomal protein L18
MANDQKLKANAHQKRRYRSRKDKFGTADRPRLTVHKSLKHFYAQLVDDQRQICLTGMSTLAGEVTDLKLSKTEIAGKIGELLAARAREKGIETIIFDRSGYLYHGRVKAFAEGARKGGLKF